MLRTLDKAGIKSIQRGVASVTSATGFKAAIAISPVDTDKAIAIINGGASNNTGSPGDVLIESFATDKLTVKSVVTSPAEFSWQVIEFC